MVENLTHTHRNTHKTLIHLESRDGSRKPRTNSVSIVGKHVMVGKALMGPAMKMSP